MHCVCYCVGISVLAERGQATGAPVLHAPYNGVSVICPTSLERAAQEDRPLPYPKSRGHVPNYSQRHGGGITGPLMRREAQQVESTLLTLS